MSLGVDVLRFLASTCKRSSNFVFYPVTISELRHNSVIKAYTDLNTALCEPKLHEILNHVSVYYYSPASYTITTTTNGCTVKVFRGTEIDDDIELYFTCDVIFTSTLPSNGMIQEGNLIYRALEMTNT